MADPNPVVIKRVTDPSGEEYGPAIEASAVDSERFWLRLGGSDYYASEDSLDIEQATVLRDLLTTWLNEQTPEKPA